MSGAPNPLAWQEAFGDFRAGIVEDLRISLPRHRVVMTVRAVKSAKRTDRRIVEWYELAFEGVTRFVFDDHYGRPWRAVELEGMSEHPAKKGKTEYELTLTAIPDVLSITCDNVRVTLIDRDEGE